MTPTYGPHELSPEALKLQLAVALMAVGDSNARFVTSDTEEMQLESFPLKGKGAGTVVVSSKDVSVKMGNTKVSTKVLSVTSSEHQGTATGWSISESDIYPGGHVFMTETTTRSKGESRIRQNLDLGIQMTSSQILHEDLGHCFATRTSQNQTEFLDSSVSQTVRKEHHVNSSGCIKPAFYGAAVVGTALMIPEVVPLLIPAMQAFK